MLAEQRAQDEALQAYPKEQLEKQTENLEGTIMPDGSEHP